MREVIESVGIDIGTSTTQLVFSKLTIENKASSYVVPQIDIVEKEVIYRSDIYFTPLLSHTKIDVSAVSDIVQKEYAKAHKKPSDLATGAVIITGETARKENANEVLSVLSNMAGDFVVATAGPDLESVLSAKGAGADIISERQRNTVANLDIGGGTTNIAVYHKGKLIGVSCLDIGGRLIKIKDNKITYMFLGIEKLARDNNIPIAVGDSADINKLSKICDLMAEQLACAINLRARLPNHKDFYTNRGNALDNNLIIDTISFSGGVADCIYNTDFEDLFKFGDIGMLLGRAIAKNLDFNKIKIHKSNETIRATVVGAGTHTTEVSGSTISYDESKLPVKNIPVVKVSPQDEKNSDSIASSIKSQLELYKNNQTLSQVAISLSGEFHKTFKEIQELARVILNASDDIVKSAYPLIIVTECDIAKALGNALRVMLSHNKEIICIDGIATSNKDYIDIGKPIANGRVVPVVIKTLIFNI